MLQRVPNAVYTYQISIYFCQSKVSNHVKAIRRDRDAINTIFPPESVQPETSARDRSMITFCIFSQTENILVSIGRNEKRGPHCLDSISSFGEKKGQTKSNRTATTVKSSGF